MSTTQQKLLKYNYILVNAWRHVSAVLTAIIRPACTTSWSDDGCKHSQNVSPCINQHIVGILTIFVVL